MLPIDARSLPPGETLRAPVCVVGAGAAGITLALELADAGIETLLLESGGYEPEADLQALYRGENIGRPYFPLESSRLRFFGGTTNHWAGVCRGLDPIDLEPLDWVPWSGWPLRIEDLEPWYDRAGELCELEIEADTVEGLPFPANRFQTDTVYFSPPTRFGHRYRAALEAAPTLRILLHANAVEVVPAAQSGRIEHIRCATLAGGHFAVEARYFVLALGGIENPRLLLASRSQHHHGVGNAHDLVGRFFMEHPHVDAGLWLLSEPSIHRAFYDWPNPHAGYRGARMGLLTIPPERRRRERLLGWSAELRLTSPSLESDAFRSLRTLVRSARRLEAPEDLGRHVRTILGDLDDAARGAWQKARGVPGADARYEIVLRSEQAPDPESRVTLGDEKDALGMPRPRLAWRLGEDDIASLYRGLESLAIEVGRQGWGRVQIPGSEAEEIPWTERIRGGWHHMGTTRMAADPRRGVVDRDCRVHGLENLYLAGSSVFPTGGWANPTLTLVALAARTANHLAEKLTGHADRGGRVPSTG